MRDGERKKRNLQTYNASSMYSSAGYNEIMQLPKMMEIYRKIVLLKMEKKEKSLDLISSCFD